MNARDGKHLGIAILSFLFPIVGLILWIIWSDDYPLKASSARNGFFVSVLLGVLLFLLAIAMFYSI